jgi:multidrug efflux pump subunit AcrA (membrane-fusion protein)
LEALVNVDETDIGKITLGQVVEVTMDAYPDESYAGMVVKIAPQTLTAQNVTTVPVTVNVIEPKTHLKPGMAATCNFIIGEERKDVLCVPNEAVKSKGDGNYVMVMRDGVQTEVTVVIGLAGDDVTEIVSGDVKEGDLVVTSTSSTTQKTTTTTPRGIGMFGGPGR